MTQRNDMTVGKVYEHLAAVPAELNPTVSEVLVACGQFVGTVLKEGYPDQHRQNVMNWFCQGLRSYVNRTSEPAVRHWLPNAGECRLPRSHFGGANAKIQSALGYAKRSKTAEAWE